MNENIHFDYIQEHSCSIFFSLIAFLVIIAHVTQHQRYLLDKIQLLESLRSCTACL